MTECLDKNCAIHGHIKTRGNAFTGKVVSAKADKTISMLRTITHYIPKYERYKNVRSKIAAHNPLCIKAGVGDTIRIEETRKLSKTKSFVVTKILEKAEK